FIIKTDEKVIGYVGLWLVLEDAQVTNIAIAPEFRGYGIGEQLFGFALQYLLKQGAKQLSLEVRKSNEVAQNLYKKFGLKKGDRKSTRLNSSHVSISYAVFCLKKK